MANKPVLHRRDHEHGGADPVRIVWESVGESGSGGGSIMFDTDPQTGDWLVIETTETNPNPGADGTSMMLKSAGDIEIQNTTSDSSASILLFADSGIGIVAEGDDGVIVQARGAGDLLLNVITGSGQLTIEVNHANGNQLRIIGLPSANPGGAGGSFVWRDSDGFLRIG